MFLREFPDFDCFSGNSRILTVFRVFRGFQWDRSSGPVGSVQWSSGIGPVAPVQAQWHRYRHSGGLSGGLSGVQVVSKWSFQWCPSGRSSGVFNNVLFLTFWTLLVKTALFHGQF